MSSCELTLEGVRYIPLSYNYQLQKKYLPEPEDNIILLNVSSRVATCLKRDTARLSHHLEFYNIVLSVIDHLRRGSEE